MVINKKTLHKNMKQNSKASKTIKYGGGKSGKYKTGNPPQNTQESRKSISSLPKLPSISSISKVFASTNEAKRSRIDHQKAKLENYSDILDYFQIEYKSLPTDKPEDILDKQAGALKALSKVIKNHNLNSRSQFRKLVLHPYLGLSSLKRENSVQAGFENLKKRKEEAKTKVIANAQAAASAAAVAAAAAAVRHKKLLGPSGMIRSLREARLEQIAQIAGTPRLGSTA